MTGAITAAEEWRDIIEIERLERQQAGRKCKLESQNPKDIAGSRKPDLSHLPGSAEVLISSVLAFGAAKYGRTNWRAERVLASRYVAAMKRHIAAWFDGEDDDSESGMSHLAHAAATIAVLIDAQECGCMIDDRPPPGKAAELIREFTKD